MELRKVAASRRTAGGKGVARQLRRAGKIPAVAYGKDHDAVSLAVSPKEIAEVLTSEFGSNTVIELDVDGKEKLTVLIGEYQYHPVTRALLHTDFLQVKLDRTVDVDVPFELTGKARGVVMGGTLRQVFRKLPVRCLPEKIPVKIVYDVTELDLDAHVSVKDLNLPEGVDVRFAPERTVAAIVQEKKRGGAEEEEEAAKPGAPAAAAEPEAKK